jgi:hypothetical protein
MQLALDPLDATARALAEERTTVKRLLREFSIDSKRRNFFLQQTFFVLDATWWLTWRNHVNFDENPHRPTAPAPGPIDNSQLLAELSEASATHATHTAHAQHSTQPSSARAVQLKIDLKLEFDFLIVPAPVWRLLHERYTGGPAIERPVLSIGYKHVLKVELYPLTLKFSYALENRRFELQFSPLSTLSDVRGAVATTIRSAPHYVTLELLQDAGLVLLAEDMLAMPIDTLGITEASQLNVYSEQIQFVRAYPAHLPPKSLDKLGAPVSRGAVGLKNIGNTCYLNSVLQCITQSALKPLFLSGAYKSHLNVANPKGTEGRLASALAQLIDKANSNEFNTLAPHGLKAVVGSFAPQFSGFEQHDAHEFLSFLLDGLSEDLSTEPVIPSIFYGSLQSTVRCRRCKHSSVTVDQCSLLSVPIPSHELR